VELRLPRLREWREKRGMSQEALSEKADVSRDSISSYERDVREAHPGTAKKLARALEVDVKSLVDMEKTELVVRWAISDTNLMSEKLRFTGEVVDHYGEDMDLVELYECPGGYRVAVNYEHPDFGQMTRLEPNYTRFPGETEYGIYTAEEVVEKYPQFGETVGVMRVRDID